MITLLYFASLRERLGTERETLELAETVRTVADLRSLLRQRGTVWDEAMGEDRALLCAVNQDMAQPGTAVSDGDEVAFFPPVTGG